MDHQRQRTIGPYFLNQTLGKGQTGIVRLGIHCTTKEKVAVKIIDRTKLSPQILSKVEREIAIMKLIEHPHVLRLYDVYENNTHLFLILEYVGGGELFDYLVKRGRLTIKEARRFFTQIISAMDFCHKHCVCHRDLKPENLLLDEKHNIKVADFGMASLQVGENLMLETSCGSPHYACPEVVKGVKYDGRKADIWSCGVILYALVVGVLPFDDDNLRHLLEKVKKGSFRIPDNVPSECHNLIKEMIKVDPIRRISMKQILNHPFLKSMDIHEQLPVQRVVKTEAISGRDNIDPDVLASINSLGCFHDKEKLVEKLLKEEDNMEKVIYYLLLERKERRPSSADVVPKAIRQMKDHDRVLDPPRKRVDSCGSPRLNRSRDSSDIPDNPRNPHIPFRPRAGTDISSLKSYAASRTASNPVKSKTPPGSPWWSKIPWRKKSLEDNPRQRSPELSPGEKEYFPNTSLDVSPSDVKKSWFAYLPLGHSHSPDKEEPFFILIKGKPLGTIKADIVHAFLTIPNVTHHVISSTTFTAEYGKHKGTSVFRKSARIDVSIEKSNDPQECKETQNVYIVNVKLISGSSQKFRKICEKLEAILLSFGRSPEKTYKRGSIGGSFTETGTTRKELQPRISGAYVISDNESEGEVLDSPDKESKKNEQTIQI
ncbi:serine/threonine-protein kinase BRSK2-like [Dendronephthya gigantea]|uniref:serine/threonine-protein kinase BRSK2-like n=1 Tax=Dendronephthya gigantea TaxID=151771 RepID=UPI00106CCC70|nr:serine/threonine-protein kinase BRSK2-like [Dendronephthya gigantea]